MKIDLSHSIFSFRLTQISITCNLMNKSESILVYIFIYQFLYFFWSSESNINFIEHNMCELNCTLIHASDLINLLPLSSQFNYYFINFHVENNNIQRYVSFLRLRTYIL